jgi:hypothetical protein
MTERSYTVSELDGLRQAVEMKWLFGSYTQAGRCSRAYYERDKTAAVEQLVRTHMLAGHTADDLYASEASK